MDMTVKRAIVPGGWNLADMTPCNLPQKAASAFSASIEKLVGAGYERLVFASLHEAPDGTKADEKYSVADITPII